VSRELKLALVVGFCVVMVVAVLVSDHLSKANKAQLATGSEPVPTVIAANMPEKPLPGLEDFIPKNGIPSAVSTVPTEAPAPEAAKPEQLRLDPPATDPSLGASPKVTAPADNTVVPGSSTSLSSPAPAKQPATVSQSPSTTTKTIASGVLPTENQILKPEPKVETKPDAKKVDTAPVRTGPVAGEKSHTIGEGDTLFKICKKYYGDGNLWKQLASYNSGKLGKDGTLKTNAVLAIPPREVLTGKAAPAALPAPKATETKPADSKASKPKTELANKTDSKADTKSKSKVTTYTIKPGDTIGVISRKLLGTSKRSQEIIDLNASSPSFSEDELTPGMVIKVPAA